jgi:N-acetylmuramoyl-L-alanine amidase
MIKRISAALFFSLATFFFLPAGFSQTAKKVLRTIIIDPGHGGLDQGAKGAYSTEADVSLTVSLKLGKAIEEEFPDTKVIFTRTTDILPGNKTNKTDALRYRADLANSSKGDLFIAVHCNAAPPIRHSQVTGYRTVTTKKKKKKTTKKIPIYRYWYTPNPAEGTETYIWALSKSDDKVNSVSKTMITAKLIPRPILRSPIHPILRKEQEC